MFIAGLLTLCVACVKNDCTEIQGIAIAEETRVFATDEGFPYCRLLQKALNKDASSIRRLAARTFDTSAGLGHGVVLVALLHKLGEDFFVKAVQQFSHVNKNRLYSNLKIGLAYTSIKKYSNKTPEEAFPKVYRLVFKDSF